jgi:hypothetical protein
MSTIDERIKQLYSDLHREYDLTLDRRKNLTSQATNLISFTSIINTILIGIIVASATNKDIQTMLFTSTHYSLLLIAVAVGFSSYIVTTIFSLFAFREPVWYRVPEMPDEPHISIRCFFKNPDDYNLEQFANQLIDATQRHQDTNNKKYTYLKIAIIFLMIGIFATVIGGATMIFTKYTTSHLIVITHIINPTISTKLLYNASDFILHINGNSPSLTDFPGSEFGVNVTLGAGSYAVTETKPEGARYSAVYSSKQILQRILVTKALDSKQQESCIEAACSASEINSSKIKLLIIDSIIYHYNAEYGGRSKLPEKIQRLNKYMHLLLKTAHTSGIAVVVTNHQTQSSVDGTYNRVAPLGGNAVSYASKYRIHLDYPGAYRRAKLDLGPCPPQDDISFAINERGFTDVADD